MHREATVPPKLLVTGLRGFVGTNLQRYLKENATPWSLHQPAESYDLLCAEQLDALIADAKPDAVIHLAAQSSVPEAFRDPARTLNVNVIGTLNLLQALKRHQFSGAFLYVSSGDVYGQIAEDALPITEAHLPVPRNPYGVSKLAAEALCRQWSFSESWRIMIARPFNHIGPGQSDNFVLPSMARQLIAIKHGHQPNTLDVGDIDVTRDFLDVRDVIHAYIQLLEQGQNGATYNVCSGEERTVSDLLNQLCQISGVYPEITTDPTRLRRAEQRRVRGSFDKLASTTGWKPVITINDTLQNILLDWESRINQ